MYVNVVPSTHAHAHAFIANINVVTILVHRTDANDDESTAADRRQPVFEFECFGSAAELDLKWNLLFEDLL